MKVYWENETEGGEDGIRLSSLYIEQLEEV
jgi:hypothetical protein